MRKMKNIIDGSPGKPGLFFTTEGFACGKVRATNYSKEHKINTSQG